MRKVVPFLLVILALTGKAEAKIDGIPYTDLVVDGTTYSVPIGNREYRDKIYYVKKAIAGDRDAREIVLGGKWREAIFIGDDKPLWLFVTADDEWVQGVKDAA